MKVIIFFITSALAANYAIAMNILCNEGISMELQKDSMTVHFTNSAAIAKGKTRTKSSKNISVYKMNTWINDAGVDMDSAYVYFPNPIKVMGIGQVHVVYNYEDYSFSKSYECWRTN